MNFLTAHQARILVPAHIPVSEILGINDAYIRLIESALAPVTVTVEGNLLILSAPEGESLRLEQARMLIDELINAIDSGEVMSVEIVSRALSLLTQGMRSPSHILMHEILEIKGKSIRPKSLGQKEYVDAIESHPITFGIGPAGTGKTYLAVAKAVAALEKGKVSRIILTRPAVEAGENLGFLPGSLTEKINPYVRPLYDALYDMLEEKAIPELIASGTIEVAPLAYMRGRTLNNAFVILDEAQNTTREQMKMFLTRLGFESTMVITGDATQVDLPGKIPSGLTHARHVLQEVDGVAICELTSADVVRHSLVADIIDAYERADQQSREGKGEKRW